SPSSPLRGRGDGKRTRPDCSRQFAVLFFFQRHGSGNVTEVVLVRFQPVRGFGRMDAHGGAGWRLGVTDHVIAEYQVMMLAVDDDRGCRLLATVIEYDVCLELIAVRAHRRGLVAERDAARTITEDPVAAEPIVRILVPDRQAALLVALKRVV